MIQTTQEAAPKDMLAMVGSHSVRFDTGYSTCECMLQQWV